MEKDEAGEAAVAAAPGQDTEGAERAAPGVEQRPGMALILIGQAEQLLARGGDGNSWKVEARAAASRALGLLESVAATAGASQDGRTALEQRARLALQDARK